MGTIRKKTIKGKPYYEARYTDPITHAQKSLGAKTEAEARQKLLDTLARINGGSYVTPDKKTIDQWLDKWLEGKKDLEPGTYTSYKAICRLYIRPKLGKARLQDLRRGTCQDFINSLDKSPKYIHNIAGVLSAALHDAVKMDLIPKNPAADLDLPRVTRKDPVAMDSETQHAFENAVHDSPYRNVFMVALHTGARISEVLGLQWQNVNLKTGEIIIAGQLERLRTKGDTRQVKNRTKSGQKRNLYAPPYVIAFLKDEKRRQNANRLRAGALWTNEAGLVFTREDGSPLPHRTIESAFEAIREKLGRPEITLHTLRKTFITNEEKAGTDIKTISAMVGHSTTDITLDIYTASTDEMKRDAAARRQARRDENG